METVHRNMVLFNDSIQLDSFSIFIPLETLHSFGLLCGVLSTVAILRFYELLSLTLNWLCAMPVIRLLNTNLFG